MCPGQNQIHVLLSLLVCATSNLLFQTMISFNTPQAFSLNFQANWLLIFGFLRFPFLLHIFIFYHTVTAYSLHQRSLHSIHLFEHYCNAKDTCGCGGNRFHDFPVCDSVFYGVNRDNYILRRPHPIWNLNKQCEILFKKSKRDELRFSVLFNISIRERNGIRKHLSSKSTEH